MQIAVGRRREIPNEALRMVVWSSLPAAGFFVARRHLLLGRVYDDKDCQERIVRRSKLDWVIVRPGILTNGKKTNACRALVNPRSWTWRFNSRADVADFLVEQIEGDAFLHKTPVAHQLIANAVQHLFVPDALCVASWDRPALNESAHRLDPAVRRLSGARSSDLRKAINAPYPLGTPGPTSWYHPKAPVASVVPPVPPVLL